MTFTSSEDGAFTCSEEERGCPICAAERLVGHLRPIKFDYEIHGNSIPHLHVQVCPRFRGDRFVGGPVDGRFEFVEHDLDRLREAFA